MYSQHYPSRNNKLINNFSQQPKQQTVYEPNDIGLNLISQPGSHLINHPSFYHQFNTRSSSPTKSTSIGEISPFAHHHSISSNKHANRSINNTQQSGVVVLHYSPDDLPMITDLDSVGSKFASSESELQKLKEHLIISDHQPTNSTSKSKNFRTNRRPLSFKKALEKFEKLDSHPLVPNNSSTTTNNNTIKSGSKGSSNEGAIDNKEDNRRSQYEMNYEISV